MLIGLAHLHVWFLKWYWNAHLAVFSLYLFRHFYGPSVSTHVRYEENGPVFVACAHLWRLNCATSRYIFLYYRRFLLLVSSEYSKHFTCKIMLVSTFWLITNSHAVLWPNYVFSHLNDGQRNVIRFREFCYSEASLVEMSTNFCVDLLFWSVAFRLLFLVSH